MAQSSYMLNNFELFVVGSERGEVETNPCDVKIVHKRRHRVHATEGGDDESNVGSILFLIYRRLLNAIYYDYYDVDKSQSVISNSNSFETKKTKMIVTGFEPAPIKIAA